MYRVRLKTQHVPRKLQFRINNLVLLCEIFYGYSQNMTTLIVGFMNFCWPIRIRDKNNWYSKNDFYLSNQHNTSSVWWCTGVCTDRRPAATSLITSDAAPRRGRLRSANRNCLVVPRCRLSTYGCRAFDYACPTVWNSLPDELRNSDSFDSFKRFMKTILFSRY